MNIGFFGDSYVDTVWHREHNYNPLPESKTWAQRLLEDYESEYICGGLGGTSQYYAISEWKKWSSEVDFDVAIFTFTWWHRLYTANHNEKVIRAYIEGRETNIDDELQQNTKIAVEKYYQYLYSEEEHKFQFDLMVKWCLELPKQFPNTKFIFIPNTEYAQEISKKYFNGGVLLDFAFEKLSLIEGERVGVAPYINRPDRIGHLSSPAHAKVKDLVKNIIENYSEGIIPVNYNDFNLVNLFPGYYN